MIKKLTHVFLLLRQCSKDHHTDHGDGHSLIDEELVTLREIHPVQGHPCKKPEEMDWDPDQIKDQELPKGFLEK